MATIKDVAKLAGVGLGTASRVLNNKGSVSPTTREKVLKAIDDLKYTPNEVARNFQKQSTRFVGLIVPDVSHRFFSELTKHIETALYKNDYKLLLCNINADKNKEMHYLQMLKMHQVAGIITLSYSDYSAIEDLELPVVTIDRYINKYMPHVAADNYQGGCLVAEALIRGGATRLGYMGGETSHHTSVSDRKKALVDKAREAGIPYVIHETTDCDNQEKFTAEEFVRMYPDVDAVFANTDIYAVALYREYEKVGKSVPEDVQIIGFDGIQKDDFFSPYLSTIVQPVEEMSNKSVELLAALIEGQEVMNENIIPVTFRQGQTSNKI